MGRSAYHFIHPIMVGGIILTATADDLVLARPDAVGVPSTSWLILGGPALYVAGHLAFKLTVWRKLSVPRVAAVVVLGLLGLLAPHVTALLLSACAAATVLGVAVADYLTGPGPGPPRRRQPARRLGQNRPKRGAASSPPVSCPATSISAASAGSPSAPRRRVPGPELAAGNECPVVPDVHHRPGQARTLYAPSNGPQVTARPVSSSTSRTTASGSLSPGSIRPPGDRPEAHSWLVTAKNEKKPTVLSVMTAPAHCTRGGCGSTSVTRSVIPGAAGPY